jgi:hypothetical protein
MMMLAPPSTPLRAFVLCLGLIGAAAAPTAAVAKPAKAAAAAQAVEAPATVLRMADWIVRSGDNQDLPFVIIDKTAAQVFVYDASGEPLGAAAALVGLTPGDDSTPGIGDRELSDIPPEDRTTPAGRFLGGYGPAQGKHEDVLWVDYATAISLHAVVTSNPQEKRIERLKSPAVDDNRITFGCINVPRKFYTKVIQPTFQDTQGVFYILPDSRELAEVFPSFWRSEFAVHSAEPQTMSGLSGPSRPSALW